jgi:hypothetical protein
MKNIILTFILSLVIIIIFYILNNNLIEKFYSNRDSAQCQCHSDGSCYTQDGQKGGYPKGGCSTNTCQNFHCDYLNKKSGEGKGGGGCFSKDSKIKLEDGSFINISDVMNGDKILSYSPQKKEFIYSPVVYIIHEKNDNFSTFIEIKTEKK